MKIFVLGAGKMGGWLARELAKEHEVAVYDSDRTKAEAIGANAITKLEDVQTFRPDMVINAVSLQNTVPAFESVLPYIGERCVLADVASVKGELPAYYANAKRPFVSVHPMFGPTFADMESLRRENVVIIRESDENGKAFFRTFFGRLGLNIFEYTFAEHDDMMAYSLATPFAASLVFAACVDKTAVPGTNFSRHMKLARGLLSEDDRLLAEVLFNAHSLPQLEKITARLEFLKHVIRGRDYEEAKRFFDRLRKNVRE